MKQNTASPGDRQPSPETAPTGKEPRGFLFSEEAISWPEMEGLSLDELARWGAQRLIASALRLEVTEYIERHASLRDEKGHALVVRNGSANPRTVQVGAAPVEIAAPRVNDRREGEAFRSGIVPPYVRRSKNLEEAIPIFYLRGWSTGDFTPALRSRKELRSGKGEKQRKKEVKVERKRHHQPISSKGSLAMLKPIHSCQCTDCQQEGDHPHQRLHAEMNLFLSRLNEQQRRWYAACESKRIGRGGDTLVSQITGLDEKTIARGRDELSASLEGRPTDRVRLPGGGRPPVEKKILQR